MSCDSWRLRVLFLARRRAAWRSSALLQQHLQPWPEQACAKMAPRAISTDTECTRQLICFRGFTWMWTRPTDTECTRQLICYRDFTWMWTRSTDTECTRQLICYRDYTWMWTRQLQDNPQDNSFASVIGVVLWGRTIRIFEILEISTL